MSNQIEIGKELKAGELCERTVVVLGREDRATLYTTWVDRIGVSFVAFYSGELKTSFLTTRDPENPDILRDDTGKRILVYEYLGVV